jgi:penicillin-binding protein 2
LIDKVRTEKQQSFLVIRLKRNADLKSVAYLSEHRAELPGVEVEAEPLRRYPLGPFASHLLGYVGEVSDKELEDPKFSATYARGDLIGRMGIERQYESYLRGVDGKRFVEVNALGRKAELLGDKRPIVPKRGADVACRSISTSSARPRGSPERAARLSRWIRGPGSARVGEQAQLRSNRFSTGITQARWNELSSGGNYPLFNARSRRRIPGLPQAVHRAGARRPRDLKHGDLVSPCYGFYQFEAEVRVLGQERTRMAGAARGDRSLLRRLLLPAGAGPA